MTEKAVDGLVVGLEHYLPSPTDGIFGHINIGHSLIDPQHVS